MSTTSFDLWDYGTYDGEIVNWLDERKQLIAAYYEDERAKDAAIAKRDQWERLKPNPYGSEFMAAREELTPIIAQKTVRAFHYTRMTDGEVEALLNEGIQPTSPDFLRRRIDRNVEAGLLAQEQGDVIFGRSPLHTVEYGDRKGFYATSTPVHPSSGDVDRLVGNWGGESAYWCFTTESDAPMIELLQSIGRGRVLEIAVPLKDACGGFGASSVTKVVMAEFARKLGFELRPEVRDIYVEHPLPASSILRIHSEGDEPYEQFGRGYPENYHSPEE